MEKIELQKNGTTVSIYISSKHLRGKEVWKDDSQCDTVACTAKTSCAFFTTFLTKPVDRDKLLRLIQYTQRSGHCRLYRDNKPPIILTPPFRRFGKIGYREAKMLMSEAIKICSETGGRSLRISQYRFLIKGDKNDEWRGVFDAVSEHIESPNPSINKLFFDLDKDRKDIFIDFVQRYCNE